MSRPDLVELGTAIDAERAAWAAARKHLPAAEHFKPALWSSYLVSIAKADAAVLAAARESIQVSSTSAKR